jgi:hypothetical protein
MASVLPVLFPMLFGVHRFRSEPFVSSPIWTLPEPRLDFCRSILSDSCHSIRPLAWLHDRIER